MRKNFKDIAPYLERIIDRIREFPKGTQFTAEQLLTEEQWGGLSHEERRVLGWQLRELLRVMSAIKHEGPHGEGNYSVVEDIPQRSPFDGGSGRR